MDHGGEAFIGFVVACGDAPECLDVAEEVFDKVAPAVDLEIARDGLCAIGFGWDDGGFAGFFERLDYTLVGVEAFVGDHNVGLDLRQQDVGAVEIAGLSGREREAGRIAQSINRRIDLGAQSAFAATDRFVLADFFLAPALC